MDNHEIRLDADKYFWGSQMLALISSVDSHKSKTKKIIKVSKFLYFLRADVMEENIKILLIEDNLGDAYLIEEHLEEFANFSYELNNVGTLNKL